MASTLRDRLDGVHPKSIGIRGESLPKKVGTELVTPEFLAMAMSVARITPKELSGALGLADQTSISKWLNGDERVTFERLWQARALRPGLVVAAGKSAGMFRSKYTLELEDGVA